ncbi:hypothetical protein EHE19_001020 [Ruminiclostridium herbifermentans]|uniref:histidine kinase n=1 Tax=Ruminiclostridium herbifermentans TaxID=2488810 RepID=A0A4U7JGQ8_9FIRM|nr:cache domain-containing protein [Ruminiclostridium herbifermentans]QNU67168.1 hypothetical protein EHE19_001020 [Ruminiclostridium herbifermentans]
MNFSKSIKTIIVILFVLLNIIFCYFSVINTIEDYEVMLSQSMTQKSKAVVNFFSYPENIINILSKNKDLLTYDVNNRLLKNNILSLFESIIVPDSRISNIYFISNEGKYISYILPDKNDLPDNYFSSRDWFKEAIKGKKQFYWISHKSDFRYEEDVISCIRRVVDEYNRPIGVVGLDIEVFKLSELVQGTTVGENGYFMILDNQNKIIASTHLGTLGNYITDKSLNDQKITNYDKSLIMSMDNKKYKYSLFNFKNLPWKIINVIPVNEITKKIISDIALFTICSLVSFAFALCLYLKNKSTLSLILELRDANIKLKQYASTIEEIAVLKERNRLARDVHDTLGQTLSILIALLQVSLLSCKTNIKETEEHINEAILVTSNGLNELRRSISGLTSTKQEEDNLFDILEKLVNNFEYSGLKVDLSVNKIEQNISKSHTEVIYRICQEALTNSIKHGKATEASIILKFSDNNIKLFIFDNGIGCKKICFDNGFGLQGMQQRIKALNGDIKFGSDGENGFNIHVEIPLVITEEGNIDDKSFVSG